MEKDENGYSVYRLKNGIKIWFRLLQKEKI